LNFSRYDLKSEWHWLCFIHAFQNASRFWLFSVCFSNQAEWLFRVRVIDKCRRWRFLFISHSLSQAFEQQFAFPLWRYMPRHYFRECVMLHNFNAATGEPIWISFIHSFVRRREHVSNFRFRVVIYSRCVAFSVRLIQGLSSLFYFLASHNPNYCFIYLSIAMNVP
jgi:hypothetical protein